MSGHCRTILEGLSIKCIFGGYRGLGLRARVKGKGVEAIWGSHLLYARVEIHRF
jgi:hypothetical protein